MIRRLFAILLLAGGLASATTIDATGVDGSRGEDIWIDENGVPTHTEFTGVIDIILTANNQTYSRDTLCVDLFTDIYLGVTYKTTVTTPSYAQMEFPKYGNSLTEAAWLIDNDLPLVDAAVISGTTDHGGSSAMGAGLQLAIWDLTVDTEDGGVGLSNGEVQAVTSSTPGATPDEYTDPNAVYWANLFEAAGFGMSSNAAFVYVNSALGSGAPAQMLEGPEFDPGPQATTPEPATFALVGGALIALGHLARRRRRS